jgi:hypothetical protein
MQHSNDNLDELFQRAAEDYPLRTDNKNWDLLASQLHKTAPAASKQSRKWQYTALLLLLLTGGFFLVNKEVIKKPANKDVVKKTEISSDSKKANEPVTKQDPPAFTSAENKMSPDQVASNQKSPDYSLKQLYNNSFSASTGPLPGIEQQAQVSQTQSNDEVASLNQQNNQPVIPDPIIPVIDNATSGNKTIDPVSQNDNEKKTVSNTITRSVKLTGTPKTLYGSLFVAPELSTIKFQHINKIGYKIGVSLGYKINSHFNVEIGVQREHKNFFSDGKYFDKSNLKLRPSTSIESLNGSAKLTSVPVSIRYNFSSKNNGQFFATGGVSAVLVTHTEKYDCVVTKDGMPDKLLRNFSSLTGTKYFSGVNVSMGYETAVSKLFKLKVEPYYQMPVKNLGVGELPLTSFGMNIGIVKELK